MSLQSLSRTKSCCSELFEVRAHDGNLQASHRRPAPPPWWRAACSSPVWRQRRRHSYASGCCTTAAREFDKSGHHLARAAGVQQSDTDPCRTMLTFLTPSPLPSMAGCACVWTRSPAWRSVRFHKVQALFGQDTFLKPTWATPGLAEFVTNFMG